MIPGIFFFIIFPALVALMIAIAVVQTRRRKQNFTEMAQRLGLESPDVSANELRGTSRGKPVRFTQFTTGGGKSKTVWSEVAAAVRASSFQFTLRPENIGWKLLELVGVREVKIGDVAFDERWRISSNNPDLLRALLIDELRSKINQAAELGAHGEYRVENGWVLYRERGGYSSTRIVQRMEGQFPLIRDLADAIDVATENRN